MKAEKIVCPHCGAPVGGIQPGKLYHCEYCGMSTVFNDIEAGGSNKQTERPSNKQVISPPREIVYQKNIAKRVNTPIRPEVSRNSRKHGYWTPVGFRSGNFWKMSVAGLFYSLLIYIAVMSSPSRIFGILFSLFYFLAIQILFGWKPLADHLPWMNLELWGGEFVIRCAYIFLEAVIFFIIYAAFTLN